MYEALSRLGYLATQLSVITIYLRVEHYVCNTIPWWRGLETHQVSDDKLFTCHALIIMTYRMSDPMDEVRYSRLCLLMLNTCPGRLRTVIDNSYRGVGNFETFLNNKIHDVFHFRLRNCCCSNTSNVTPLSRYQWDLLYARDPTRRCTVNHGRRGECPCQYNASIGITSDVLDITYCCFLLTNICPGNIPQADVNTLRQVRNELIHANSASIDEPTFNRIWASVEQA